MLADARHARLALVGGGLAVISVYIAVHRSVSLALALAALPLVGCTLLRPSRGLGIALILTLAVPYWWSFGGRHAYQYASVLAAVSVLSTRRRRRFTATDCALGAYVAVFVLGWLLQYEQPETWHIVLDQLIPLGFYLGARAIPRERFPAFMTLTLFGGTVGALTVIYEFVVGHVVFADPTRYLWNASHGGLFRAGGIFGSPPGAATVLMYVFFFGLAGLRSLRGRAKAFGVMCLGICTFALVLTFTRAPLIGAGVGLLVFLWLVRSPLLRPTRAAAAAIALTLVLVLVLPTLKSNSLFQAGVARGGTLTAREGYWQLALPIAFASPHNFVVGIGTGVLETPALFAGAPVPYMAAAAPQVFENSLHNQYVTTLVEEGVIGLASLVFLLVATFAPAARAARADGDAAYAAIAATTVGMAVVLAIDTELLHTPSLIMLFISAGFATTAVGRATRLAVDESGLTTQRARVV